MGSADVDGGTMAYLAQSGVLSDIVLSFTFEPKGTKKTLKEIFRDRDITDQYMKSLYQQEADRMVAQRYLLHEKDGVWVFSKDEQGRYSWEHARYKDRVMNFINR